MAKTWHLDAGRPDSTAIARAADIVRQGGLVILPTRGLYGIGGDAFSPAAVERIFRIKARSAEKAILLLIEDMDAMMQVALPPSAMAIHLMRTFWPGKVTFVLVAHPGLPSALTANSGKIGVRLVAHPVAAALVRAVGGPLTGTSANLSGAGGSASVDQLDSDLLKGVDGVLDVGPLAGGPGSTVVDATGSSPKILREGAVSAQKIMQSYNAFQGQDAPRR